MTETQRAINVFSAARVSSALHGLIGKSHMGRGVSGLCLLLPLLFHSNPLLAAEVWPSEPVMIAPEAFKSENISAAIVRKGSLAPHIDVQAYISADLRRVHRIRPVGSGRVREVMVTPGDIVHKGQILLVYDNFSLSDEKQRLLTAEAALRQAKATEREAVLAEHRASVLRGGVVSAGEVERRRARLQDARSLVAQQEATLQNARERMARFTSTTEKTSGIVSSVVSPVDGIVRSVNIVAGEDLVNGPAAPVEVDDLSHVWVISQVPDREASLLDVGDMQHTWVGAIDGNPVVSHVDVIEGGVDPGTRRVLARSLIPNPEDMLRPGKLVRSRIFAGQAVSGVIVPSSALQTIDGKDCVFVRVGPEKWAARQVTTGPSQDGKTVITEGLKDGETIIVTGSYVLKSQALLKPSQPGKGSAPE
ncbi:MAG: efflux RND transporter periplasmic adaptor subunit [Acetobacter sp.]|nr:efflux RND transporter periplasmic adaptor subunit [Acetobacter sp.]MCH4061620.1 efflux RND transporter periplasmic adaptor subunit [Acetobacter sp.]MCH4089531.1 efflux RND transporter periplasmic adaptor subunit [Acetobacter sp.]MCI1294751.1 efflux RND transporter periplasmic adaptor subunit [Acetobacter sp.]MCI1321384.1 efflux RND transporter periplasmic adaptor subunit [Acetobacter sp.]